MKLGTLMLVTAIVAGLFGIGFVLAPAQVLAPYGVEANAQMEQLGGLFGATLILLAVLTWSARNAPDSPARQAIVLGIFVGEAIGFVVSLMGQLEGVMNALGWSTVAIYAFFTLAYGYFQFLAKPEPPTSA